jgi:hypothetical protein
MSADQKAGVDVHAANDDDKSAVDVAHDRGSPLIEQLLNRAAQQQEQQQQQQQS